MLIMDIELKCLVGQTKEGEVHMEISEYHVRLATWSVRLKRFVKYILREAEYRTGKSRNRTEGH